jgi:hypothetical protein
MLRKALFTTGLVGVALALSASPAAAKHNIDWKTKAQESKGRAIAKGVVRIEHKYTKHGIKRRVVFEGRLDDRCPADGYGAYLNLRFYYDDGSDGTAYADATASDERDCDAKKARRIVLRTGWVRDGYAVSLQLYKYDRETGDITFGDQVQRQWGA